MVWARIAVAMAWDSPSSIGVTTKILASGKALRVRGRDTRR